VFFYSEFDLTVLEERKAQRGWSEWDHEEPLTSSLKDPKEEPGKEMTLDLENWRYNFYLRSTRGEV
jgi:hypothetical protein